MSATLTPAQVAALHGVSAETVRRILRHPARRAAIFPGAVCAGDGARAVWLVPEQDARAWTPRKVGRPKLAKVSDEEAAVIFPDNAWESTPKRAEDY